MQNLIAQIAQSDEVVGLAMSADRVHDRLVELVERRCAPGQVIEMFLLGQLLGAYVERICQLTQEVS